MKQMQFPTLERVHVAVLCPEGSATTILLNCVAALGGSFVCADVMMMPVPRSNIILERGEPKAQQMMHAMVRMFSVPKKRLEEWTGVPYDPVRVFNMVEFLERQVPTLDVREN